MVRNFINLPIVLFSNILPHFICGANSIFIDSSLCDPIFYLVPYSWSSVAAYLIYSVNNYWNLSNETTGIESQVDDLIEIGKILLASSPPWISGEQYDTEILLQINHFYGVYLQKYQNQGSDTIFGVFALLSTTLELAQRAYQNYVPSPIAHLPENDWYFLGGIRWVLVARFELVADDKVQAEMDRCGFSPEQQDFIWRWIRREINLVADTADEEIC